MVETVIIELMEGDKGKEIRHNALKWQEIAKEATSSHGSSSVNLENLIEHFLIKRKN